MRLQVLLLAIPFAFCVAASGQDKQDKLQSLYGDPIGKVYRAADDVIVTASLESHSIICAVRIEHESRGRRLTDAEVNDVIDKVAPKADRGEYIIGTFLNVIYLPDNDCAGVSEKYKRLSITKIGSKNEYMYVAILYHRPECEIPKPPPSESKK